jgi:hypothetical protein
MNNQHEEIMVHQYTDSRRDREPDRESSREPKRESRRRNGHDRPSKEFNFYSFLWRFIASLILVLATYNPTEYSFVGWLRHARELGALGPEHFVVGVVLLIGWVILLAATSRSLGAFGLILGGSLLGGVVWLLIDVGLLDVDTLTSATWVSLICVALLLAVGLSWSHVWRRLTGQFEVDDGEG